MSSCYASCLARESRSSSFPVASRIKIFRCSGSFSGAGTRPSNRALNCLAARWRARCVRAAWQERGRGRCKNATRFTTRTQFRLTRLQRGNEPYYKEEHGCPGVTHLDGRKLDLRGWNWLTRTSHRFSGHKRYFYRGLWIINVLRSPRPFFLPPPIIFSLAFLLVLSFLFLPFFFFFFLFLWYPEGNIIYTGQVTQF